MLSMMVKVPAELDLEENEWLAALLDEYQLLLVGEHNHYYYYSLKLTSEPIGVRIGFEAVTHICEWLESRPEIDRSVSVLLMQRIEATFDKWRVGDELVVTRGTEREYQMYRKAGTEPPMSFSLRSERLQVPYVRYLPSVPLQF